MIQVNIHEAKTHLSDLIEKALKGERVVLCKRNIPLAMLSPLVPAQPVKDKRRLRPYPKKFDFSMDALEPLSDQETAALFGLDTPPPKPPAPCTPSLPNRS